MSLERQSLASFASLKRILLIVLTIFVLIKPIFSLIGTIDRPQIQGKFDLYQTNLVLTAAEWKPTADLAGLGVLQTAIIGTDFLKSAIDQYTNARTINVKTIEQLVSNRARSIDPTVDQSKQKSLQLPTDLINQTIATAQLEIDGFDLRLGILQTAAKQPERAIETWQKIIATSTQSPSKNVATSLIEIWNQPSSIDRQQVSQITAIIDSNFDGWFRDRILHQLYTDLGDSATLAQLDRLEQSHAQNAAIELIANTIPRVILGLIGVGLIVFFSIRLIIRIVQNRAQLSIGAVIIEKINAPWIAPWDWEIVCQVFVIGFFLVGQFILPNIFGAVLNPSKLTTQGQAIYIFTNYLLTASFCLGVLYLSIKSYLPLPPDWFKFNWGSNWALWGIGGYLVATPIVIIVSLLNDRIWQGQGGSNPILQIVLEGKDPIALWLFFLTAAVMAPIFEEFLFRGFLLPSLSRYVPVWGAIGLSGLFFGLAHLSLSEIVPLTTLGIILGVVYARTRNLLAPMLLHSLWNSSTLISLYILGSGNY